MQILRTPTKIDKKIKFNTPEQKKEKHYDNSSFSRQKIDKPNQGPSASSFCSETLSPNKNCESENKKLEGVVLDIKP